jgi:GT2 family glycosyltransferase
MNVSIVIVNWNTEKILHDCLKSVYANTGNLKCEVIVVDNASSDGSVEMVKNDFPDVILIENESNRGFAAANNQGMSIAVGEYVLLLNSDTVILDNAIVKTISFADANPKAAVMACKVLNRDRTLQSTCFLFPSILNLILSMTCLDRLFPNNRIFGRERLTWCAWEDVLEVDVVAGCFMLVRRKAIEEVGVMDEEYFMYAEETDWCYRFKQRRWRVVFTPVGEIIHIGGVSSKQMPVEMLLQLFSSTLLFFKKNKGKPAYVSACFLVALFFLLRVLYWFCLAIFRENNRSSYAQKVRTYFKGFLYALVGGRGLRTERQFEII